MAKIGILDDDFVPHGKIDPESLIFRSESARCKIGIDLHSSAINRFEANLPAKIISKSEEKPNLFRIEFKFDNLDFINEWLLQFPKTAEIVYPEELINKRVSLLREMVQKTEASS